MWWDDRSRTLALADGSETGQLHTSGGRGGASGSSSAGKPLKGHAAPAAISAPGGQGRADAPAPKPPRSRRSGRGRNSNRKGTSANGAESDSDSEEEDSEEEDVAASSFGGVAAEAQRMCSDALTRLQRTSQWSPQGLAALDHAFAGIVQVGCFTCSLAVLGSRASPPTSIIAHTCSVRAPEETGHLCGDLVLAARPCVSTEGHADSRGCCAAPRGAGAHEPAGLAWRDGLSGGVFFRGSLLAHMELL